MRHKRAEHIEAAKKIASINSSVKQHDVIKALFSKLFSVSVNSSRSCHSYFNYKCRLVETFTFVLFQSLMAVSHAQLFLIPVIGSLVNDTCKYHRYRYQYLQILPFCLLIDE